MDVRSRPPRIFLNGSVLVPFDFVKSQGKELIRKYKLKTISNENIEHYEEIRVLKKSWFPCLRRKKIAENIN